jgi:hypothetical protein
MVDKSLVRSGNIIPQKFEHFFSGVRRRQPNIIVN